MTHASIIQALHDGAALVKYSDKNWSVIGRHGELVGGNVRNLTACRIIREWPDGLHYCKRGEYEEWRRKAGLHNPERPPPIVHPAGICRICGCNPSDACHVDPPGRPCAWADASHTLCDHPQCLAKAGAPR